MKLCKVYLVVTLSIAKLSIINLNAIFSLNDSLMTLSIRALSITTLSIDTVA